MRKLPKSGYRRVREKHGGWYFIDRLDRWHFLCRTDEGEPAMLRALAKHKDRPEPVKGSMQELVHSFREKRLPEYAEVTRYDYGLMLHKIEAATIDRTVTDFDAGDVLDIRDQWRAKPRSANKYHALLSVLMTYAIERRQRTTNPCSDVKKLPERPRRTYQRDETTLKVWDGAITGKGGKRNANGPMYVALFTFAYLTALRAKDVRTLRWDQVGEASIFVEPTKTQGSSAAKLAVKITPDIRAVLERARTLGKVKSLYVFHTLKGGPLSASAVKSAWRRARERAGESAAWFRDMRPKALSDAKRAGRSLQELADAAAHSSVTTTEDYLRGFEVKDADLQLPVPARKVSPK